MRVNGFSVVRNVLPAPVVKRLRDGVRDHFRTAGRMQYGGKFQLRGLHVRPDVARILLSEPVMEVVRRHVPPGAVLLTGECDLMMNTTSGWHKDITPDMGLGPEIYDDPQFGVYKLGIYLQDQDETSPSAFRVRPGTHLRRDGAGMAERRLATRVGDIVVFDVRLDHSGQPQTLTDRLLHRLARLVARMFRDDPEAWFTRLRTLVSKISGKPERLAVFLTFGPDAPSTRAYEAAGRHRHGLPAAPLSADARSALDRLGVSVVDAIDGTLSPPPGPNTGFGQLAG